MYSKIPVRLIFDNFAEFRLVWQSGSRAERAAFKRGDGVRHLRRIFDGLASD